MPSYREYKASLSWTVILAEGVRALFIPWLSYASQLSATSIPLWSHVFARWKLGAQKTPVPGAALIARVWRPSPPNDVVKNMFVDLELRWPRGDVHDELADSPRITNIEPLEVNRDEDVRAIVRG